VLAGLVGASGLIAFYAALASGTMGVVSPIAALGAVVPVLLGLLRGETPSALVLAGLVLALLGVVTASGPELSGGAGARPVALASLAGVCFGLALIFIERGAQTNAVMTMTGMRATSVTLFFVAALALRTTGGLSVRDVAPLAWSNVIRARTRCTPSLIVRGVSRSTYRPWLSGCRSALPARRPSSTKSTRLMWVPRTAARNARLTQPLRPVMRAVAGTQPGPSAGAQLPPTVVVGGVVTSRVSVGSLQAPVTGALLTSPLNVAVQR
jgi:hypothetical protein